MIGVFGVSSWNPQYSISSGYDKLNVLGLYFLIANICFTGTATTKSITCCFLGPHLSLI